MDSVLLSDIKKTAQSREDLQVISPIDEIIEDFRNGRMVILIDDETRENEGDLVIPAQMATPDVINFMATHGRGLICLALDSESVSRLGLPLMAQQNTARHSTAFTVSIEAREGVSTGISAPDRARTIQVAIAPDSRAENLASPGHVFPLKAKDGGVLVRAGHTEAAVDLAKMAGMRPAGVICEIMKDDGSMARLPDLVGFAQRHGMKIGTIADLIAWRLRHEQLVECIETQDFTGPDHSQFTLRKYTNKLNNHINTVLVKGNILPDTPCPVRVHSFDMTRDALHFGGQSPIEKALRVLAAEECGVLLLMQGMEAGAPDPDHELRNYGIGAQILRDLNVRDMILLSSHEKNLIGAQGFGLNIAEQRGF